MKYQNLLWVIGCTFGALFIVLLYWANENRSPEGDDIIVTVTGKNGEQIRKPVAGTQIHRVRLYDSGQAVAVYTEHGQYEIKVNYMTEIEFKWKDKPVRGEVTIRAHVGKFLPGDETTRPKPSEPIMLAGELQKMEMTKNGVWLTTSANEKRFLEKSAHQADFTIR